MTSQQIFLGLMGLSVALEAFADVLLKRWANGATQSILVVGLLLYFVGTVFWALSLKYESLAKAIMFFTVANVLVVTLIGVFVFHEQLTFTHKMGIVLGVVSLALLEM